MARTEKIVSDAHDADAVHQQYLRLTEVLGDYGTRVFESYTIGPGDREMNRHDNWIFPRQEGGDAHKDISWIDGGTGPCLEHQLHTRTPDHRLRRQDPAGNRYPFNGRYLEIVPEQRIVFNAVIADAPGNDIVTTVTFEEENGKTRLTVRQDVYDLYLPDLDLRVIGEA